MQDLPVKGSPKKIKEVLIKIIAGIIEKSNVKEFYLGTTCDLITTRVNLNCDTVLSLYETFKTDDAVAIENELINHYKHDKKCINIDKQRGENNPDYPMNIVFLALWNHA